MTRPHTLHSAFFAAAISAFTLVEVGCVSDDISGVVVPKSDAGAPIAPIDASPTLKRSVLTILVGGEGADVGKVTSADGKILCGAGSTQCSATLEYAEGSSGRVDLTALAPASASFKGWLGACGADVRCITDINKDTTIIAEFDAKIPLTLNFVRGRDSEATVSSTPPGLAAMMGGKSVAYFEKGARVNVDIATPTGVGEVFRFQDACMGTNGRPDGPRCTMVMDVPRTLTVRTAHYNYAFLTSSKHLGNLGGLTGADTICNTLAATSGLPGNFKALLSDSSVDAITRLGTADGWRRTDDAEHIGSAAVSFATGAARTSLYLDEAGKAPTDLDLAAEQVFTGTNPAGQKLTPSDFCGDWKANVGTLGVGQGFAMSSDRFRLSGGAGVCSNSLRYYCFGTDLTRPVPAETLPANARKAFLSTGSVTGGAGMPAFDQVCQTEAAAAGFPNAARFKALVAPSNGVSAASRFDLTKGPWASTDKVLLAPDAKSFMTTYPWRAGIYRRADGSVEPGQPYLLTGYRITTGLATPHASDPGNYTCDGWVSNLTSQKAGFGNFGFSGSYAMSFLETFSGDNAAFSCGGPAYRVYCLED